MPKPTAAATLATMAGRRAKIDNGWGASIPFSFICRRWRRSRLSWKACRGVWSQTPVYPSSVVEINHRYNTLSRLESGDLALRWPFTGIRDQISATRILSHIFPFLGIALAVTDQMVKKPLLPMRWRSHNCFGESSLESPDPLRERKVHVAANEKVNVIRHNDVPAYANFTASGVTRKLDECAVDSFIR